MQSSSMNEKKMSKFQRKQGKNDSVDFTPTNIREFSYTTVCKYLLVQFNLIKHLQTWQLTRNKTCHTQLKENRDLSYQIHHLLRHSMKFQNILSYLNVLNLRFKNFLEINDDSQLPDYFDSSKVQFQEKEYCQLCIMDFNTFNRRHHCRRCGKSVCTKCSMNKRQLSKNEKKELHRVCDYCDTVMQNTKFEQNYKDIIQCQQDQIELFNYKIEKTDDHKTQLQDEIENRKKELQDLLTNSWQKKETLENQLQALRSHLEKLNNQRNSLYVQIGNEEKQFNEKEEERNKLAIQKSIRLTDLADKEQDLANKQYKNQELKQQLEELKKRFAQKTQQEEEQKSNTIQGKSYQENEGDKMVDQEQQRLEKMRKEKLNFYLDSIAQHRIDEASETSSFVSVDHKRKSDKKLQDKRQSSDALEVVNEQEVESSIFHESVLSGGLINGSQYKQSKLNEELNVEYVDEMPVPQIQKQESKSVVNNQSKTLNDSNKKKNKRKNK